MRIFGLTIKRADAAYPVNQRGWRSIIREPFSGAWQRNEEWTASTVLAYHAVYACVTLIAADIGKLRPKLVERDENGIWSETTSAAFSPVIRKPNRFQNHIQFKEWWITSKLLSGNAYALKQRDDRNVVEALYLLDASRVTPLVAGDGSVYYEIKSDNLAGVAEDSVRVPASEIIHDRMNCLFHPLVGVSPIYACGSAADQGIATQNNSRTFFGNNSAPGGVLTAPAKISDEVAVRLKEHWEANYTGTNAGRIAVLGDGLHFEPMRMSAVDSQLIEQLKWTAEVVCSCFHVPAYMVGVGPAPTYNNIEALAQQYYTQCLQSHIESMELCLDEGLGLDTPKDGRQLGTELDLDGLLRMDTSTQMATLKVGVDGAIITPNEARAKVNLGPLDGGDTVYMQQQQFSLAALAQRDASDPFAKPALAPAAAPALPSPAEPPPVDAGKAMQEMLARIGDEAAQRIERQVDTAVAKAIEAGTIAAQAAIAAAKEPDESDGYVIHKLGQLLAESELVCG